MRRLYAAAQLDAAPDVVSRLLRGGAEDLMDNELDPKNTNEEAADTNDEAIKGRAKDEEAIDDADEAEEADVDDMETGTGTEQ